MKHILVDRSRINIEALDDTFRADLGAIYQGISQRRGQVIAHLAESASLADIARARQLVIEHDETALSARQQAQLARRQRLQTARQNDDGDIELSQFISADPLVRQLAQKVLLLSLEVQALRNTEELT